MLKVAVAGLGAISRTHIEVIKECPQAELVAVCDCNPDKQNKYPEVTFYSDFLTMLENQDMDCVHLCLPHHLHAEYTRMAAQRGVSVLVEKPGGLNHRELASNMSLEKEYSVKIGVCLQNRFNAAFIKLKEIKDHQTYGQMKGLKAVLTWSRALPYYEGDPWRGKIKGAGSGVLLSQAVHTIDLMRHLSGEIKWVSGRIGKLLHERIEVEDSAMAHMEFVQGGSGVFFGTVTHCHDSSVEFECVFEEKTVYMNDQELWIMDGSHKHILEKNSLRILGEKYYGAGHSLLISAFYDALLCGGSSYVPLTEAYESVRVIDAIIEADERSQRVYMNGS